MSFELERRLELTGVVEEVKSGLLIVKSNESGWRELSTSGLLDVVVQMQHQGVAYDVKKDTEMQLREVGSFWVLGLGLNAIEPKYLDEAYLKYIHE